MFCHSHAESKTMIPVLISPTLSSSSVAPAASTIRFTFPLSSRKTRPYRAGLSRTAESTTIAACELSRLSSIRTTVEGVSSGVSENRTNVEADLPDWFGAACAAAYPVP